MEETAPETREEVVDEEENDEAREERRRERERQREERREMRRNQRREMEETRRNLEEMRITEASKPNVDVAGPLSPPKNTPITPVPLPENIRVAAAAEKKFAAAFATAMRHEGKKAGQMRYNNGDRVALALGSALPHLAAQPPSDPAAALAALVELRGRAMAAAEAVAEAAGTGRDELTQAVQHGVATVVSAPLNLRALAAGCNLVLDTVAPPPSALRLTDLASYIGLVSGEPAGKLADVLLRQWLKRVTRFRSPGPDAEAELVAALSAAGFAGAPRLARAVDEQQSSSAAMSLWAKEHAQAPTLQVAILSTRLVGHATQSLHLARLPPRWLPPALSDAAVSFAEFWQLSRQAQDQSAVGESECVLAPPPRRVYWDTLQGSVELGGVEHSGWEGMTLVVSTLQGALLHLVDSAGETGLTYSDVRAELTTMGANDAAIQSALLSLTAPRHPILVKTPPGPMSLTDRLTLTTTPSALSSSDGRVLVRTAWLAAPSRTSAASAAAPSDAQGAGRVVWQRRRSAMATALLRAAGAAKRQTDAPLERTTSGASLPHGALSERELLRQATRQCNPEVVPTAEELRDVVVTLEETGYLSRAGQGWQLADGLPAIDEDEPVTAASVRVPLSAEVYRDVTGSAMAAQRVARCLSGDTTHLVRSDGGVDTLDNDPAGSSVSSSSLTRVYSDAGDVEVSLLSHLATPSTSGLKRTSSSAGAVRIGESEGLELVDADYVLSEAKALLAAASAEHAAKLDQPTMLAVLGKVGWDLLQLSLRVRRNGLDALVESLGLSPGAPGVRNGPCAVCCEATDADHGETMSMSSCGHTLHTECWGQLLQHAITGPQAHTFDPTRLTCPNVCGCLVAPTLVQAVSTSIDDAALWDAYNAAMNKAVLHSYMSTGNAVECSCGLVAICRAVPALAVCKCGERFCVGCKARGATTTESHWPASCEDMAKWRTLNTAGGPERLALLRLKPCPRCGRLTNKCGCDSGTGVQCATLDVCPNAACDHITCEPDEGGCGYEWCWVCSGDYNHHRDEWHQTPRDSKERFLSTALEINRAEGSAEAALASIPPVGEGLPQVRLALETCVAAYAAYRNASIFAFSSTSVPTQRLVAAQTLELFELTTKLQDLATRRDSPSVGMPSSPPATTTQPVAVEKEVAGTASDTDTTPSVDATTANPAGETPSLASLTDAVLALTRQLTQPTPFEPAMARELEAANPLARTMVNHARQEMMRARARELVRDQPLEVKQLVRRGPDWEWADQDYAGGRRVNGYITQLDQPPGWVTVQWLRGGANNVYRMGAEGRYDLMPTGGTHTDPDGE